MPYTITMTCDRCGVIVDVPARTVVDVVEVVHVFLARLRPLLLLSVDMRAPMATKCPSCSQLPPEPGVVRVGEL